MCWDLGSGVAPDVFRSGAVVVAGPQGSEYTGGVCVCPAESVLNEGLGNHGACTIPILVPTAVPTSVPSASPTVSGDTAALVALIEALQSHVSDLQSVDSDLLSTIAVMESVDSAMEKDMSDMKINVDRVVEWKRKVRQGTDKLTTRRTPRMKLNDDDTNDTNYQRRS